MDQQQLAMIEMYGPPPPMPPVKNNPGVGRPSGSSTDPVNIPVPGSPVLPPQAVPDSAAASYKPDIPPWPLPEKGRGKGRGRPKATEPTLEYYRNIARRNNIQGTSTLALEPLKKLLRAIQLI